MPQGLRTRSTYRNVDPYRNTGRNMGRFDKRYSDEQKAAATGAYLDRGVRPRARILELAKIGQLLGDDGRPVPAFAMPDGTLASYIRDERRRRTGRIKRAIAEEEPRDAIELLRRRCISAADALLDGYEKQLRSRSNGADPDRLRQIVRVVREAASLPGPNDARPPKPGAKVNGERHGAETKPGTGLGGRILADVQGEPPRTEDTHTDAEGTARRSVAGAVQTGAEARDDGAPGSLGPALAEAAALRA